MLKVLDQVACNHWVQGRQQQCILFHLLTHFPRSLGDTVCAIAVSSVQSTGF